MFILQPMTYLATDRPVAVKEKRRQPDSHLIPSALTLFNLPVVVGSFYSGDGKVK